MPQPENTMPPAPKGARRIADIPPDVLAALNAGTRQTATLAEGLAVDFAALLRTISPAAAGRFLGGGHAAAGVTRRMAAAAEALAATLGPSAFERLAGHPADTVRGWAAFVLAERPKLTLRERLVRVRPLAADPHFGVREWAWLALRPHIAADPSAAIRELAAWTAEPSDALRRFASESTRPRGVWCAHIEALKSDPALGLPVLEPLRADPSKYVQDSVGNWLNDAAKSRPDWVRALCRDWSRGGGDPATARILRRATRSLARELHSHR
jgi:3-methyladenine DNA glycosylase AlkC